MSCEQKWCLSIPVQSIKAFTVIYPRETLASRRQDLQVISPSLALWSPTHQWGAPPYWMRNNVMFCKTVRFGVSLLVLHCCYCSVAKSSLSLCGPMDCSIPGLPVPRNCFSFSTSPPNEYSGLISFRTDLFNLLSVQGTLKSLLQHHNSKESILLQSAESGKEDGLG